MNEYIKCYRITGDIMWYITENGNIVIVPESKVYQEQQKKLSNENNKEGN